MFEEDCSEQEVAEELAPLTVQLGFVLGRLGRVGEAQEAYEQVGVDVSFEDAWMEDKMGSCLNININLYVITLLQVLSNSSINEEVVRAVAHNNMLVDSGRLDGGGGKGEVQKKVSGIAAKRLEVLLDRDKVGFQC